MILMEDDELNDAVGAETPAFWRAQEMLLKSLHGAAEWVRSLLIRQHSNVVACALGNKLARAALGW